MAGDVTRCQSDCAGCFIVSWRWRRPLYNGSLVGRARSARRSIAAGRARTAQWEKFVAVDVLAAVAEANQVPAAAVTSHQSIAAERAQIHRNRAISPPLTSVTPRIDAPGRSDGGSASILHPNMSDKGRRARRAGWYKLPFPSRAFAAPQTSVVYYAPKMVVSDSSGADSRRVQDYRLDCPSSCAPVCPSVRPSLFVLVPMRIRSVYSITDRFAFRIISCRLV